MLTILLRIHRVCDSKFPSLLQMRMHLVVRLKCANVSKTFSNNCPLVRSYRSDSGNTKLTYTKLVCFVKRKYHSTDVNNKWCEYLNSGQLHRLLFHVDARSSLEPRHLLSNTVEQIRIDVNDAGEFIRFVYITVRSHEQYAVGWQHRSSHTFEFDVSTMGTTWFDVQWHFHTTHMVR